MHRPMRVGAPGAHGDRVAAGAAFGKQRRVPFEQASGGEPAVVFLGGVEDDVGGE